MKKSHIFLLSAVMLPVAVSCHKIKLGPEIVTGDGSDGNTPPVEEPVVPVEPPFVDNVLVISEAGHLLWFAAEVNVGNSELLDADVRLDSDIDLAGVDWTPIGPDADDIRKFKGTFDGNGKTISNLTVKTEPGYTAAGFFGALDGTVMDFSIENAVIEHITASNDEGSTDNGIAVVAGSIYPSGKIENVTVRNATVSGNRYLGGIAGYVYGSINDCNVENITLTAVPDDLTGSFDNGDKVGGIAGYFESESVYTVKGNKVSDFTIRAYRDCGGIIGAGGQISGRVSDNIARNGTVTADQSLNYYGDKTFNAREIVGRITSGTLGDTNSSYQVEIIEIPGSN